MPSEAMTTQRPDQRQGSRWIRTHYQGLLVAAVAVVVAILVSDLIPLASPLLVAILLGIVVANTVRLPDSLGPGLGFAAKPLLRVGVALLGLQLVIGDIVDLGWGAILVVVAVVALGFAAAVLVGRRLGVRSPQTLLIAAGFSICGAAAVAAVNGVVDSEEEETATAIGLVVVFGTLMIPLVPLIAYLLDMSATASGMWAGASVLEVAQVVAASGLIGSESLEGAVLVKLARVLLLAPIITILSLYMRQKAKQNRGAGQVGAMKLPPIMPFFVMAFIAFVLIRSFIDIPAPALNIANLVQSATLAAAMFALGCGVRFSAFKTVGVKPLLVAIAAAVVVLGVGLGGVLLVT